jgi:hypothetical protein
VSILAQGHQLSASWGNQHNVHPAGLAMLMLACAALIFVRRKHAMLPIVFIAMFVTAGQRVVVADLDFPFLRILVMLGGVRVFMMGESRRFKMIPLDWMIIAWGAAFCVASVIRENRFIYCCGWTIDNLGAYFMFRVLLKTREEIYHFVKWSAILAIPVAVFFLVEKSSGYNVFSVFGGVASRTIVREGKLRCMGAFQHPILAGCFFSGLFPMLAILWKGTLESKRSKIVCAAGMIGAGTVIICCASSTPVMALAAGLGALCLYRFHKTVPALRWGFVLGLFILHFFIMKKPVWHLVSRIDITGGSTGYHRYRLIDAAINNFSEWMVVGIVSTEHWGFHLYDVTGHFILQGTEGGLLTFLLFFGVLTLAFRSVRRVMKRATDPRDKWMAWCIGASLFANCVSFIGVSYFGKPLMLLQLQFAALGSLEYAVMRGGAPARVPRQNHGAHAYELGAAN